MKLKLDTKITRSKVIRDITDLTDICNKNFSHVNKQLILAERHVNKLGSKITSFGMVTVIILAINDMRITKLERELAEIRKKQAKIELDAIMSADIPETYEGANEMK